VAQIDQRVNTLQMAANVIVCCAMSDSKLMSTFH